jgi:cytochrome P450
MADTPPGPTGEPVLGSGRRYADDPFAFISALEESYGDISRFEMGPIPTYLVTDPDAIERILVSDADQFSKPEFQGEALGELLGEGLLLSEGETWQRQRDLAQPAFSMRRLLGMADRITDHATAMTDDWTPGSTVDAELETARVTLSVILDLMMGVELPAERIDTVQSQLEPLGRRFEPEPLRFAIPDWVPMPGDAEYEAAIETLDDVLDEIIERRRGTEGDPSGDGGPMDFLSVLLRAQGRGEQSAQQLRDEMMTMLLAGHDTTALTLTYTLFLLSEHPEVRERVEAEVDEQLDGEEPTAADVREFEYLEWVIDEAMRLYPPVFALFRTPDEPVELCGYTVPDDASVMLPQWGVHRSSRFWEGPDSFDPERFSPERGAGRPRFAFFPFGGGPRHCIGKHLAMLEAQLILATVLSQYRLEFEGETPLELSPSLTMHPRQEMTMRIHER